MKLVILSLFVMTSALTTIAVAQEGSGGGPPHTPITGPAPTTVPTTPLPTVPTTNPRKVASTMR